MVKKQSKSVTKSKKHFSKTATHFVVRRSLFVYALLVFAIFFMLAMTIYCLTQLAEHKITNDRMRKVQNIYSSLEFGDSNGEGFRPIKSTLKQAGLDKNDDGKYFATADYARNASQYTVRKEIADKAVSAGFKRIGGNGEDAITPNDTYENTNGDRLRVVVRGKYVQDALIYGTFESDASDGSFDLSARKNDSPSYVHTQLTLNTKK